MKKITIIIPVDNYDEAEYYYRKVLGFSQQEELFFLPVGVSEVALKLLIIDEKAKSDWPPQKHFPIFCYRLEKNFLSYCKNIYEKWGFDKNSFFTPGRVLCTCFRSRWQSV